MSVRVNVCESVRAREGEREGGGWQGNSRRVGRGFQPFTSKTQTLYCHSKTRGRIVPSII